MEIFRADWKIGHRIFIKYHDYENLPTKITLYQTLNSAITSNLSYKIVSFLHGYIYAYNIYYVKFYISKDYISMFLFF